MLLRNQSRRICKKCGQEKSKELFERDNYYSSTCNECHRLKTQAELEELHSNPEYRRQAQENQKAKYNAFVTKWKSGPCADCGKSYPPYVMEFHHLDPNEKDGIINVMLKTHKPPKLIEEEVRKCVLLCSNCHRIREHENNWNRKSGARSKFISPSEFAELHDVTVWTVYGWIKNGRIAPRNIRTVSEHQEIRENAPILPPRKVGRPLSRKKWDPVSQTLVLVGQANIQKTLVKQ